MLTPEEIEAIRREEVERLNLEAGERDGTAAFPKGSTPRMDDPEGERLARAREAREVRKAIEAEFWLSRGYEKYVTHHGKELWLTPEQIKERKIRRRSRRRSSKARTGKNLLENPGVRQVLMYLAILGLGVFLGLQLVR